MTWWLSRSYSQILRACWVKSCSAPLPGVWGKVHSTQSSGLFMQHAFPSFSAARKVPNAFFYPDTCPWFIELSHSAIQLHSQPAVAFLSLKTISFLSQTEKESRQRRTKGDWVAKLSCGQTRGPQQLFFFKSRYCMWSETISTTIFKSGYFNGFWCIEYDPGGWIDHLFRCICWCWSLV